MSDEKDLVEMIHILTTAIAIHEKEEEFFETSSREATNEVAKQLYGEIARELRSYREKTEERKHRVMEALEDLQKIEAAGKKVEEELPAIAMDPVCAMLVEPHKADFISTYKGKKYYFCAPGCKKKFDAEPAKFA